MSKRLVARTALGVVAASAPAYAEPVAGEEIHVEGTAPAQPNLTKLTEPLVDTSQSIDVVSGELLEQRAVTNLNDALRTVPGISLGAGEFSWQGNNPTIRGFLARNDMFLDGLRDFGSYYRDPFNAEDVQVLEGPSSVMFGRGSTGGAINQAAPPRCAPPSGPTDARPRATCRARSSTTRSCRRRTRSRAGSAT